MACKMCDNAVTNPELTRDNDLSYICVGNFDNNHRMMMKTGDGKPTELLIEKHTTGGWVLIGYYRPKHCPECGRELIENQRRTHDGKS